MDSRSKFKTLVVRNAGQSKRRNSALGWAVMLLGCGLWTYGYFVGGSLPFIRWTAVVPTWISDYLPNWQSEVGLLLATLGSIPLYIAQIQDYRQRA